MSDDRDQLDRLLAEARWAEPTADSTRRLTVAYLRARRLHALWRGLPVTLAVAATVALVATLSWRLIPTDSPAIGGTGARFVQSPILQPRPDPISRPATAHEVALLRLHERQSQVDRAVEPPDPTSEQQLMSHLPRQRGEQAAYSVRLLSETGSVRSLPTLVAAAAVPSLRSDVIPGLIRLADAPTLAATARAESDPQTRARLLTALLHRESATAVPIFLGFVNDADLKLREAALLALDAMGNPPVEAFFAAMNDPNMDRRYAAARALGRCADTTTLHRIATLLDQPERRREAIIALLHSREHLAATTLAAADHDRSLNHLIRYVRQEEPSHERNEPVVQQTI